MKEVDPLKLEVMIERINSNRQIVTEPEPILTDSHNGYEK